MKDKEKNTWMKKDNKEIEDLVISLAKQGLSSEKIGLVMRDTHGVPKVKIIGKKISSIIKEGNIKQGMQDVDNLNKKAERLQKHLEKNKVDKGAKRSMHRTKDKLKKLVTYYNRRGILK